MDYVTSLWRVSLRFFSNQAALRKSLAPRSASRIYLSGTALHQISSNKNIEVDSKMATENLAPAIISRIMGEIRDLVKNPTDGIRYVENDEDTVSEIHAVLDGPEGTPFVGGRFRMKLVIPKEYPNAPPRGFFLTKIYHPNVAENGDICVNTLKKDWTTEVTLKHILQVIRCLLIVPFPESALNCEAGKLFMESYDEFARRAKIMTEVHALPLVETASCDGTVLLKSACSTNPETFKQSAVQKKEKDAKKKSLKRL